MKPLLLTLLTCSVCLSLQAQIPDYLGNNPIWKRSSQQFDVSQCSFYEVDYYYVHGDTVINSMNYKKVYRKGYDQYIGNWTCQTPRWYYGPGYQFAFRQNGRKLYKYSNGTEELFFDYDLNVGDTLKPCTVVNPSALVQLGYLWEDFIVNSIDSIYIYNQYHRKYILDYYDNFANMNMEYHIIEGVRNESLIHYPQSVFFDNLEALLVAPFEYFTYIDCYFKDSTNAYPGGCDINDFTFTVGINSVEYSEDVILYPNPSVGAFNIDIGLIPQGELKIFTTSGKLVHSQKLSQSLTKVYPDLDAGVYFWKLYSSSSTKTGKLVITY